MHKFIFHADPGHGWLAAKRSLIERLDLLTQILRIGLYLKGFHFGNKLTAVLYPFRSPHEFERNVRDHFFILYQLQQVYVRQHIVDLVELQVFENGLVRFAVDLYFGDLEAWCVH